MKKCKCGRDKVRRYNSAIEPPLCPSCTYAEIRSNKTSKKSNVKGERKKSVPWRDKPTSEMIIHVQDNIVNPYIRERDNECFNGKSISDNGRISDAGHYYSRGAKQGLRFCIQNIHGQSKSGNRFKGSDAIKYRKGLVERFGEAYVAELDKLAMLSDGIKSLDKYNVILIAETYLHLRKKR
jgi:hypothetical protein